MAGTLWIAAESINFHDDPIRFDLSPDFESEFWTRTVMFFRDALLSRIMWIRGDNAFVEESE